ncbi:hypothetical protein [Ornithinimicrobium murale]|uniref:hypothetical protein n=1 Tax=Ornithinimicrobium murale TaxID=1050153 RepID=UPI0013B44077|nr:hypothetical protein [Ornithinimicrobium murale]
MTVHLFALSPDSQFLHASDRWLTDSRSKRRMDDLANKVVAVLADDALFTIGSTGHAYIGETPIDVAIVEAILGTDVWDKASFVGRPPNPDPRYMSLGKIRKRITEHLTSRTARIPGWFVQLGISGFHRRRQLSIPFMWDLQITHGNASLRELSTEKVRYSNRTSTWTIGSGRYFFQNEFQRLLREPNVLINDAAVLAGRYTASQEPTVGPDVMLVEGVIRGDSAGLRVQYRPAIEGLSVQVYGSLIPEMYTPWIVTPNGSTSPSVVVGQTQSVGGLQVEVLPPPGAPPIDGDVALIVAPIPRPGSRGR